MKKRKLKKRIRQLEKYCKRMSKELLRDEACWLNEAGMVTIRGCGSEERYKKWAAECKEAAKWK